MAIASDWTNGGGRTKRGTAQTPLVDTSKKNVEGVERWASIGGGGFLALWGFRRGGPVGVAAGLLGAGLLARGVTQHCTVKAALSGSETEQRVARAHGWSTAAIVTRAVTINKPKSELYAFWRDFSNLGHFMENIEKITVLDEKRSKWTVKAPLGGTMEWEAIVIEDEPNRRIAWEAAPGADVQNAGWVEFADGPDDRGTEVRAFIAYEPPGGQTGRLAAKILRKEPAIQARRDLKRFKQLMETGEIATSKPPHAAPRPG